MLKCVLEKILLTFDLKKNVVFQVTMGKIDRNAILHNIRSSLLTSVCDRVIYLDINSHRSQYNHPFSTPNGWTASSLASGEIKDKPLSDFSS